MTAASESETNFREEVRAFFRTALPDDMAETARNGQFLDKDGEKRWQRILYDRGWAAPAWPKAHGGPGWSPRQQQIFEETMYEFDVPIILPFGTSMVGPVIYTFGTEAQRAKHLPGILKGEVHWCQGYSEPGSGSDLASLSTHAVRDGDDYVINGVKVWTTYAHRGDWMFCLVRTDREAKPQRGISFILIDMTTPGIEVNPIVSIDNDHHLNMVYFTDVRVPAENLIGEENRGWDYAKFLLGFERTSIAEVGLSQQRLRWLKQTAAAERADGAALWDAPEFRREIAALEIELQALEGTALRYLAEDESGGDLGAKPSILKIKGAEIRQRMTELFMNAAAYYAGIGHPSLDAPEGNLPALGLGQLSGATSNYMFSRAASIYGGTNEVQRNVLSKMTLGL